jgi:FMN phosphatase YigB (HAD superfamily)
MAIQPLNNLQGMLFDLGGTLDGDGEHWLNRFHLLYQELLPEVSWDDLKCAFYEAEAACLLEPQVARLNLAGLLKFHVSHQLAALGRSEPEKGGLLARRFLKACQTKFRRNAGVLTRLAGRFRLGVVSNFYGNASLVLAEAGMLPVLRTVVDSRVAGVRKPDPVIFSLALDSLGLPGKVVAYVGDSYAQDIRPAKRAGLITIWLRNDAMSAPLPADFAPELADYQIRTLSELEGLGL